MIFFEERGEVLEDIQLLEAKTVGRFSREQSLNIDITLLKIL